MAMPLVSIPAHVPSNLVRDVDVFNIQALNEDVHLGWKQVQDENPDLFYTPHNGGHWLATRAELIEQLFGDKATFSPLNAAVPPLPPGIPAQPPLMTDLPDHRFYRGILNPWFTPKAVQLLGLGARRLAIELVEGLRPLGHCEFVAEFAQHLPLQVFMDMVKLPMSDREYLIGLTEVVRNPDPVFRLRGLSDLSTYIAGYVIERTTHPGDDLISAIALGKIGDRPIRFEEVVAECTQVLLGGLDTVASSLGFIACFLASSVSHRQQLIDEPSLIALAVDELFRRYSIAGPARVAAKDTILGRVEIRQGDAFFISSPLHGLDERRWPSPLTVDFNRDVRRHMAFGQGIHRCPGSLLARAEMKVFLEEWLKRIPHFKVKPGTRPRAASGSVTGMTHLELCWDV